MQTAIAICITSKTMMFGGCLLLQDSPPWEVSIITQLDPEIREEIGGLSLVMPIAKQFTVYFNLLNLRGLFY